MSLGDLDAVLDLLSPSWAMFLAVIVSSTYLEFVTLVNLAMRQAQLFGRILLTLPLDF